MNLDELEAKGRKRAALNQRLVDELGSSSVTDTFDDQDAGISIHDPWKSSCGRFDVDPYKEYGRAFIEWLWESWTKVR